MRPRFKKGDLVVNIKVEYGTIGEVIWDYQPFSSVSPIDDRYEIQWLDGYFKGKRIPMGGEYLESYEHWKKREKLNKVLGIENE